MFIILLISSLAILLVWVVFKWIKIKKHWAERNVPHEPPNPIFGSLTFLKHQNINIWLRDIYVKYNNSPYIGIWFFWRPALVVNSPVIARNILIKDFAIFRDRFVSSGDTDPLGGLNLFTVNDPTWSKVRRQITSVFTSAKLKTLQGYLNLKGKDLVQRISKENENEKRIDLRLMFTDYTTDIIGSYAFGLQGNVTSTGEGVLRNVTKEFMKYSLFRAASWISIFFIPDLVNIFRFKYFPRCTIDYFRRIFKEMTMLRKASHREVGDLLDVLLKIQKENEYSDDFIISQAAIMLLGGFDGTGTILTYIIYELAWNPDMQERVYQELLRAKQRNESDDLDYETLAEADYLNSIIKETLRKYVGVGWLDRIASTDYKVDDNLTIKAGTPVYINMTGMHYDPKYFPEPNTFNPDRFMPENEKDIVPYTYMPFGEGNRVCIGKRFGLISIRFALSSVLLNFEVRKFDDCPSISEIKTEKLGLFLSPGEPMHVEFVPRLQN